MKEVDEARKALQCLYIAVSKDIADDVSRLVEAAFAALRAVPQAPRVLELARIGAQYCHEAALDKTMNIDEDPTDHVQGEKREGDPFGFSTCPHPDCLLARAKEQT